MIKAVLAFDAKPKYFTISGHSGYADNGSDIICSAVSAVSQTAVLGLQRVVGVEVLLDIDEKKGYLNVVLPEKLNENDLIKTEAILLTMREGLLDIQSGYPNRLKVEDR